MAQTLKFELVSPERLLLAGDAEQVVLPGSEGDMTVLPGHAPVVSTLRPGVVDVTLEGAKASLFVSRAFAEIGPDRVTVLAERAYDVRDFSQPAIEAELADAERVHAAAADDEEKFMSWEAINALTKLKTAHW